VAPKKEKKNRCDADVRRQLDRMDLVIELSFSEIHRFSRHPELGRKSACGGVILQLLILAPPRTRYES
jgi:hypothetical protein